MKTPTEHILTPKLSVQARLPIDDRIERAAQLVLRARIFFEIWLYFEGRDTRAGIFKTMEEYSEFFRFAPHAHFVAFIVSIAALFDKRRDTITLPGLAREMAKANLLPFQTKAEVDALMAQAVPLVSKVALLRHNAFAHRSATITYDDAFKAAAVTALQMQDLTEIALKVANHLTRARGRGEHFFNELPREDAEALMKALAT
ncbi:hypothetical protein [Bradyrhizobium sp.]|jgi:hypothetical protein|uniref:AbiU2 domain-containing protein n=1 Tax=Bradyrhizobium sp. TaxID=376 RepID=UPI003C27E145